MTGADIFIGALCALALITVALLAIDWINTRAWRKQAEREQTFLQRQIQRRFRNANNDDFEVHP